MINKLKTSDKDFTKKLQKLIKFDDNHNEEVVLTTKKILADVKQNGDSAIIKYSNKFDNINISKIDEILIPNNTLEAKFNALTQEQKQALLAAKERIYNYHKHQVTKSWQFTEEDGSVLGQKITAIDKVGLYVPGGKASYPSSVLMNAIPAKVAGVNELIMVVPTPNNKVNDLVLAAAYICEVDKVFTIGGAQAVAALAYGTEFIPKVNKIVGPGNIYVATAKKEVFGLVGIDMIAGPSEILIICDGNTNPDWIAMDLFSQAEHDEDAQAILLSDSQNFITEVEKSIKKLLPTMSRADIIKKSIQNRGILILTKDLEESITISNDIAPEHLELSIDNPEKVINSITNAGAIFMGRNTSESLGDYCAGANHVLPTSGTAKFSSPLGVDDFIKKSSIVMISDDGASKLGRIAEVLATSEGLEAHAKSAKYRIK